MVLSDAELVSLRKSLSVLVRESPLPWRHAHPEGGDWLDDGYVDAGGEPTILFGERYEGAVSADDKAAAALVRLINAVPALLDDLENERMAQLEADEF